ncbi:MAG: TonB-dependent receptor [Bacteriodetes bacterium]|nr:TonB-dependent receptor [Bacteroidota bacterium]
MILRLVMSACFFVSVHVQCAPFQGINFTGVVSDSITQLPIQGATVMLIELHKRDITHADGSFHFQDFPKGSYSVGIRYPGYKDKVLKITVVHDTMVKVLLTPWVIEKQAVIVESKSLKSTLANTQTPVVLTPAEVDVHRGQTLGESLQDIPGVTLLQTGASVSKPVIHGLHSQRIAIVNSGVIQEGQQWGAEHAPEIDAFASNNIEVLKGPASVEYGAGALGGVIRVESKEFRYNGSLGATLFLNGFSNSRQGAASFQADGGNLPWFDNTGWRTQFTYRRAGDSQSPLYTLSNTGFQEINGNIGLGVLGVKSGYQLSYSLFTSLAGILSASHIGNVNDLQRALESGSPTIVKDFTYTINPPKQQIEHHTVNLNTFFMLPVGKLEMQYGWQRNDRYEFDAHNSRITDTTYLQQYLNTPAMNLSLSTYSLSAKLHHHEIGSISGVVGLNAARQRNVRDGRVILIPDYTSYSVGGFILENYTTQDWAFTVGSRYDWQILTVNPLSKTGASLPDSTFTFTSFSGALGVLRQLSQDFTIALNLSSGWRPPQVSELYSNDVHHGTAQFEIGTTSLLPERSYAADVSLHYNTDRTRTELSAYGNYINNYIFLLPDKDHPTVTIRGVFPTFYYTQANSVISGIDATAEYQFTPWIRGGLLGAIVRGNNVDSKEPLLNMPADRITVTLHLHTDDVWGFHEPFIEVRSNLVAQQTRYPVNVDLANPPRGYTLFSLQTGGTVPLLGTHIKATLEATNVFNTEYRDYLSRYRYFALNAGRNIILRITIPMGVYASE